MGNVLILGYGNSLRRDDGVGPWIAERAGASLRPAVAGLAVQQLTPELAETIAGFAWVVFVDAKPGVHSFEIQEVSAPASQDLVITHASSPAVLVGMAARVFGGMPRATLLTVPAHDFEFGEGFSDSTQRAADQVLAWLRTKFDAAGP